MEPAILFRKARIPKIAIIHNDIQKQMNKKVSEVFWSRFPWLYFQFEKFILTSLDFVYTTSRNTLEFYLSNYFEQKEKFSFFFIWLDSDIFNPTNELKLYSRKKLGIVLFLSSEKLETILTFLDWNRLKMCIFWVSRNIINYQAILKEWMYALCLR